RNLIRTRRAVAHVGSVARLGDYKRRARARGVNAVQLPVLGTAYFGVDKVIRELTQQMAAIYKYSLSLPHLSGSNTTELRRQLGLLDSTCIVVGTTIGVGIFLVPGLIARELGSPRLILATWVVTGIISLFGALAY